MHTGRSVATRFSWRCDRPAAAIHGRLRSLAVIAIVLAARGAAHAQTINSWVGASGGSWGVSSNWSLGSVPTTGQTADINGSAGTVVNLQTVAGNSGVTVIVRPGNTLRGNGSSLQRLGWSASITNQGTIENALIFSNATNSGTIQATGTGKSMSVTAGSVYTITNDGGIIRAVSGGTLSGITAVNGGTLSIDSTSTMSFAGSAQYGPNLTNVTATNNGTTIIDQDKDAAGSRTVYFDLSGSTTFDNFGSVTIRQTMPNPSDATTKTSRMLVASAAAFTNRSTGTLNIQQLQTSNSVGATLQVYAQIDASGFNNQGAINITTATNSTGSAQFRATSVGFANAGRVTVDGPKSSIEMAGQTFTQTTGSLSLVNGGGMTAGGIANANLISLSGGRLQLGGNVTGTGSLSFTSGTLAANANLSIANAIALPGVATFNYDGFTVDVTGNTSGVGSLVKTGSGTLRLSGSGSHSGGTTLTAGGLDINNAAALGSGTFTIGGGSLGNSSGAAVTVAGSVPQSWTGDFAFAAASPLNLGTGGVAMSANRTVTVDSSVLTVGGAITGGGSVLTKAGQGALRLSGSNSVFGGSAVSAGGLIYATRAAQTATGTATVAAGATLGLGVSNTDAALFGPSDLDALFSGTATNVSNATSSNVGIDTSAGNFTYGSSISGQRGLVKYGANALTLTGASSFSGGTVITDGSIIVGNASGLGSGSVSVPTGGTLNLGGQSIANAVVVTGGTLSSGTINAAQVTAASGRISAVLSGAGFTKTGTGTLVLAGNNTYTGTTTIAQGGLRVEAATGRLPAGGVVALSSTSGLVNLTIDNVGATGAVSQSVGPLSFGAGAGTVSLTQTVAPDLLLTSSSISAAAGAAGNLVPSGSNSATNGFASSQPAGFLSTRLFFSGSSYAWNGGTNIRGITYGTDAGTQTSAGGTTVSSTTHLQLTGNVTAQTTGTFTTLAFTGSATTYTLSSGSVTVTGLLKSGTGMTTMSGGSGIRSGLNADLDIRTDLASGTLAISHVIAANGSNGLTKSGEGTLSLSGANTFSGLTRPLEGTLVVGGTGALRSSTLDVSAATAGIVTFGTSATLGGLTGSRDLGFGGFAITVGNNGGSTSYSGILSNGSLVKTGTGTLTLSGSSTLANATSINNGVVAIDWLTDPGQASPLGTATLINLGSGSTAGTLWYTGSGHTTDRAINLSGTTGGGVIEAAGSGGLVLSGIGTATGAGTKTLTLTGTSTAANAISVIAGTSVSVNKTGRGLWRLTGASSYDGQLQVLDGTLVVAATVGSQGNSPFGTGTNTIIGSSAAGATGTAALLAEGATISRGFSVAASGSDGSQVVVLGGTGVGTNRFDSGFSILLGRSVTLQASTGGTVEFASNWRDPAGNVNPSAGFTVGSPGNAGTVIFSNSLPASITAVNVVAGTARLNGGTDSIWFTTPVSLGSASSPGTLDVNGLSQSLASLSFTGNGSQVSTSVGGGTLRLFNNGTAAAAVNVAGTGHEISAAMALDDASTFTIATAARLLVSGAIATGNSGGRSLTKTGGGILELSGANTYSGNTTVSDGTLVVNGSLGGGTLSVAAAAMLMGSGTIGGAATIAGIHSPGNSPGIETFTSNLTYSGSSSQVVWELWGNTTSNSPLAYDQIVVGGTLDFADPTSLTLVFSGTGSSVDWDDTFWATNQTWTLFDVAGTTSNFGNFSLTASPESWLDAGGQAFADSIRKDNSFSVVQDGNNVWIQYTVVVPEPASLALAGIGIAAAAWAARRRRP